jgi:cation transport regulator
MPYASIDDLPAPVRGSLPEHAQEIFVEAFNHAFAENHAGGEVTAFKIAWGAVKKSYHKKDGRWIRKEKVRRAH